jgi:glycosyltransferase involved in cell wall biosynthesis
MINKKTTPVLTIAIPTFNRSTFLQLNLQQLNNEIKLCPHDAIELLVSDNASVDETECIVECAQKLGMSIKYIKNDKNIGSDANIAQCFNMARGRYVLILGDDDLLVDGVLPSLLNQLKNKQYGVVFLKSYGYNNDFRKESPGGFWECQIYNDSGKFIEKVAHLVTLISGCIINKEILGDVDAIQFCGSNLVQVNLVISAALNAKENLYVSSYSVACKRNNSEGYNFSNVFVENFFNILDSYQSSGLTKNTINKIENHLILSFFPFYIFKQRMGSNVKPLKSTYDTFNKRFGKKILFKFCLVPILLWPKSVALFWGGFVILIGRVYAGDFRRGVFFLINRLRPIEKKV